MSLRLRARSRDLVRSISGANELIERALTLPTGQIRLDEARFLGELVAGLTAPGPIIEIGTLFGYSTRVITLFKAPQRELITVDNYAWNPLGLPPDRHRAATADALADAVAAHRVRIVCQDKADFYSSYAGPAPALVFLDAVHSYEETKKDIDWARRAAGGVICLHDYSAEHPGVVRAVDEAGGPKRLVQTLAVI